MNRFKDKVVLVTGGNRNTGLWIVKKFVDEGARVFMCGSTATSTAAGVEKLKGLKVEGVAAQACDDAAGVDVGDEHLQIDLPQLLCQAHGLGFIASCLKNGVFGE